MRFIIKDSISFNCSWFRLGKLDIFTQSLIGESKKLVDIDLDLPWKSDNDSNLDLTIPGILYIELELDEPTFELFKKKACTKGTKSSKVSTLSVSGKRSELIFYNAVLDYINYRKVGNIYRCKIIFDHYRTITK